MSHVYTHALTFQVPYLVPLPPKHTLTVKRPDSLSSSAFGDLREDNLQLVLVAKKIVKTQVWISMCGWLVCVVGVWPRRLSKRTCG